MMMPGRSYAASGKYRYGFNGKENDNEVKVVEGSQQDYGFRIYDPRLGRFLSVDPIAFEYPELTPYQFASNRPIEGIDLDGLEFFSKKDARGKINWYYATPKAATGYETMQARGLPVLIDPMSNNTTKIHTVTFKKTESNTYIASQSVMVVQGPVKGKALKVGQKQPMRNGASITLTEFSEFTNKRTGAGTTANANYSGMNVKVEYKGSNKKVSSIYFLQSVKLENSDDNGTRFYDASSGSNPFYFPEVINKGKFQDQPSSINQPNSKSSFTATLVVYEKRGEELVAVGKIDYSFDITHDKNGKGKVTNVKQTFTDLSLKQN